MDSGLYAAYTGLLARTQALDTAANNLANAGTVGFRAQRDYFSGVLAGIDGSTPASQVGNAINDFGILGGSLIDEGQGTITATGNPLDLALDGQGFFAIQTPQGIQYTRDGGFTRSSDGQLQTQQGEPVLDPSGQPITIPSGTISVASDGSISVTTQDGSAIAGRIGIFDFPSGAELSALGTNRFAAPPGLQPTASDATIQQGALEGANLDTVHGTMQLILIQRQAEMMQKALSVFNNDFDKTAAEDLGRV
ncbi:MAG TPA: flagellar hook basal-body protein [Acidobacteriaceae bacterium]|nr:flagellar hook basal-body protein [Acidobacteriaceae bacterium]